MSPFKVIKSETVWSCPWYYIRRDDLLLPSGDLGEYNVVVDEFGAVLIVPLLVDGRIVLIKQYRHTVGRWSWEVPAGRIEQGEPPKDAAKRELAEEIGGRAADLVEIGEVYTAPGFSNEVCHIYLATDVEIGESAREALEFIEIHSFEKEEVLRMVVEGEIKDGLTLSALFRSVHLF